MSHSRPNSIFVEICDKFDKYLARNDIGLKNNKIIKEWGIRSCLVSFGKGLDFFKKLLVSFAIMCGGQLWCRCLLFVCVNTHFCHFDCLSNYMAYGLC